MALRGELHIWDDSFVAEAAITDRAVVVRGTDKTKCIVSAGDNAPGILGVSTQVSPIGGFTNITRLGKREVLAAGNITAGDQVVAAADGKVKKVADLSLSDGDVVNVVGEAEVSGVANDVVDIKVAPYTYIYKS